MKKYPVVALCGDAKWDEAFERIRRELTLSGHIVIAAGPFRDPADDEAWAGMEADALRAARLMQGDIRRRQIDMADSVFLVNPEGEPEESEWSELCYARMTGKPIQSVTPIDEKTLEETVRRHIVRAKELAEAQSARRSDDGRRDIPADCVYFTYDGAAIFDPWLSARDQTSTGRGVDPFQYYGAQKAAAFIERILAANDD